MDIEEALYEFGEEYEASEHWGSDIIISLECAEAVLNELDKKDKIINEIAEMLVKDHEWFYSEFDNYTKQDFIDYFTKKVTKED